VSYRDGDGFSDNKLYALIWILVACLLGAALFKGCEANNDENARLALKAEAERNAVAFAQSECTSKGGTMYSGQCVVCPR
jgi:CHASE1-domain containing sensor protein